MGRSLLAGVSAVALVFAVGVSYSYAAKPIPVIQLSNGYPSGAHFNLNIHGKKGSECDPSPGGSSVFVPEYGVGTLTIVTNKKSGATELTALDKCSESFDGDPAKVRLPAEAEGYYVFARIGGKPKNGTSTDPSSILLVPNPVLRVCNDTDPSNPDFGGLTECPNDELLALGLVTNEGAYKVDSQGFFRFDPDSAPGKGKNNAVDITGLFTWTGYVCSASLDTSGDGVLDAADVPASYDTNGTSGIQQDELDQYLADQAVAGACTKYTEQWVFNVADLVEQDTTITNDGTKLLQVRFYPVATTLFTGN